VKTINGVSVLDTLEELVDPAHTAVVVVDVQNDFCHAEGHFGRHGKNLATTHATVPGFVRFVNAAQDLGLRTIFLRQLTLPHGRSDSPAWLRFKCRDGKSSEYTLKGSWGAELIDGLAPREGDVMIEKFRPDGFLGTPLDAVLRANAIQTTVLLGTTTEGCVESTVRGASYHDYYTVVVKDLLCSPNQVQHEGSMRLFEARYPMAGADELLAIWARKEANTVKPASSSAPAHR
jgi:ureidoacrylate peracid hydrolase